MYSSDPFRRRCAWRTSQCEALAEMMGCGKRCHSGGVPHAAPVLRREACETALPSWSQIKEAAARTARRLGLDLGRFFAPGSRGERGAGPSSGIDFEPLRVAAYEGERPNVQALVPPSARRVLDLGCSTGALGAALKRRQGTEVVGLEFDTAYVAVARERLDQVVHADLNLALGQPPTRAALGTFDCIIAADVLEHLVDPWSVLRCARELLRPTGAAVVSVPNVRHWRTFLELGFRGRWPRHVSGIFDATHLRWFTLSDATDLLTSAGLAIDRIEPQYGAVGWHRAVVALLRRTPVQPLLATQYVLRGISE